MGCLRLYDMDMKEENLTDKPITDFVPGEDTIYLSKMMSGSQVVYLCRFVSYERGVVTGDVIEYSPCWAHNPFEIDDGLQVRARLNKCYLFGRYTDSKVQWPYCHWFDGKTKRVKI